MSKRKGPSDNNPNGHFVDFLMGKSKISLTTDRWDWEPMLAVPQYIYIME